MLESLLCYHFHILVGIFIIELGLYIPTMGFLKCPRSSWASKLDAHPLSFQFELSYTYSSSASVAWQSLLLALTSIDGHLHSPLISRIDVRLSPFFVFSTQPPSSYSIPPIMLYPCLTLMYCMRVEKSWSALKSMNQLICWNRGCAWWEYFVWRRWSIARLYEFVGMSFLWLCYFNKT